MLIVVEWCRILSRMAVAITGSPKISFHCEKLRLEVRIKAPFSGRVKVCSQFRGHGNALQKAFLVFG